MSTENKQTNKNCLYIREWSLLSYHARTSFHSLAIDLLCLALQPSFRMRNKRSSGWRSIEGQNSVILLFFPGLLANASIFTSSDQAVADSLPYLADTFKVPKERNERPVFVQRSDLMTFSISLHAAKPRPAGQLHGPAQRYHLLFISCLIRLERKHCIL